MTKFFDEYGEIIMLICGLALLAIMLSLGGCKHPDDLRKLNTVEGDGHELRLRIRRY